MPMAIIDQFHSISLNFIRLRSISMNLQKISKTVASACGVSVIGVNGIRWQETGEGQTEASQRRKGATPTALRLRGASSPEGTVNQVNLRKPDLGVFNFLQIKDKDDTKNDSKNQNDSENQQQIEEEKEIQNLNAK